MIIIWLLVWLLCDVPSVHPWNAWFITLIISLVFLLYRVVQ